MRTVVGILTTMPGRPTATLAARGPRPFGERTEQFAALASLADRRDAILCIFAPAEVDWQRRQVTAAILQGSRWVKRRLPLPAAVYNRLPSRGVEAHPICRQAKLRLRQLGVAVFNPDFFDKWVNHQDLWRQSGLQPYLPYTEAFVGAAQVSRLLGRFGRLYCKPRHGHAGSGILLAEAVSGAYTLRALAGGRIQTVRCANLPALARAATRRMAGKAYLVQQAVPVARYRGRAFDFRLLLHKSPSGRWGVTGAGIRVAGQEGITTHVPNGGSLARPEDILTHVFHEGSREPGGVYRRVRRLAVTVARALDEGRSKRLGEMSMDIGVGPEGQLWFFEANAKPMKFDEQAIQERGRLRLVRLLLAWARRGS